MRQERDLMWGEISFGFEGRAGHVAWNVGHLWELRVLQLTAARNGGLRASTTRI